MKGNIFLLENEVPKNSDFHTREIFQEDPVPQAGEERYYKTYHARYLGTNKSIHSISNENVEAGLRKLSEDNKRTVFQRENTWERNFPRIVMY